MAKYTIIQNYSLIQGIYGKSTYTGLPTKNETVKTTFQLFD